MAANPYISEILNDSEESSRTTAIRSKVEPAMFRFAGVGFTVALVLFPVGCLLVIAGIFYGPFPIFLYAAHPLTGLGVAAGLTTGLSEAFLALLLFWPLEWAFYGCLFDLSISFLSFAQSQTAQEPIANSPAESRKLLGPAPFSEPSTGESDGSSHDASCHLAGDESHVSATQNTGSEAPSGFADIDCTLDIDCTGPAPHPVSIRNTRSATLPALHPASAASFLLESIGVIFLVAMGIVMTTFGFYLISAMPGVGLGAIVGFNFIIAGFVTALWGFLMKRSR
ncbi:MAG: hypothetical protein U0936_17270 [Planctomycetaceae bacterium]